MTGHEAIRMHLKAFVFLTIFNAINQDSAILIANKNINPINDCKRDKIDAGLISDFILSAHNHDDNEIHKHMG